MDINTTANSLESTILDQFILAGWLHKLQTVAVATLVLILCAYVPTLRNKAQLAKLPRFDGDSEGNAYLTSARKIYRDGYEKFRDSVYRIRTSDGLENIVIPHALVPELRKLPDDVLSFPRAIDDTMEVKYTRIQTEGKLIIHSIKSDLTPALSRLNPIVRTEIDSAMEKHLPPCKEWTEININQKLVDIVARVSGRIFVGPELCQDPEYLECSTHYTVYLMQAVHAIKQLNPWFKSYTAPRTPEIKRLRDMEHRAKLYLEPLVRSRLDAEKNDPNWERPDDMLQWIINRYEGQGEVPVDELVKAQLGLIFAAIHTTTTTATCILYTLAVTPEYIAPLRDEIKEVMAQNEGEITSRSLQQMVKLDSYMKEVGRMFPLGITSFSRHVLKDFTLSNGQRIPKGVNIEIPSEAISNDSTIHPDSANFDGFRHYKLRNGGSATDHAKNQFVTTNESNLFFGYGRHACPGRFFATNEIKMILAKLILDYDIKMPGEGVQVGLESRHPDILIARGIIPDASKTLMFKKIEA